MGVRPDMPSVERNFHMDDGIDLVADTFGASTCPPALLLHGGGQTRHAWKRTASRLASHGYFAIAVDLRGHGESGWSADGNYQIDRFAKDVRSVIEELPLKPVLIGASLGGVASLIAAGEAKVRPVAAAIVLVDITPRVDPAGLDRIRGFMRAHVENGFATLEEVADAIATYLPHRSRPKTLDGLRKNLRLDADGRYRWHYDPAFVRNMSRNTDGDREGRLTAAAQRVSAPFMLVRGGSSELVSEEAARAFVEQVPNARFVDVQGATHMVAGDLNDAFTEAVLTFLDGIPSG